ncbi:hypothetical protein DSECCO2_637680 [anaerobic digester metagenome]
MHRKPAGRYRRHDDVHGVPEGYAREEDEADAEGREHQVYPPHLRSGGHDARHERLRPPLRAVELEPGQA